jgi:TRAP-type C4-dicarboxylate transport system permease small subunit
VEIDLLSRQYGGIVAKLAKALFRALAVIAGLLLLAGGIALVSQSLRTGRIDYGLITMPIWVPQLLIPIGGGLMAILFAITDYDLENPEELPPE